MKRILVVAVAAILAWCGFTFFSNHAGAEAHAAEHGHEHEHEEVDFDNIPLSQKQVDAVDLKMGEAVDRVMDATIAANGQLVLRAQNKGDVASLMGGVVKAIYVKEGQNVKRGQVVLWSKIQMWSVCNANIFLPARSANWHLPTWNDRNC